MSNPTMTIGQLREALAKIDAKHDDDFVTVWLPGSRIDLNGAGGVRHVPGNSQFPSQFLIEGNVREGSAL